MDGFKVKVIENDGDDTCIYDQAQMISILGDNIGIVYDDDRGTRRQHTHQSDLVDEITIKPNH